LKKLTGILAGPLTGGIIYFVAQSNQVDDLLCRMIFVTVWIAVWWMTGAVDIGVTSFLPLILMPLLGIMKTDDVAARYIEHTIFLFIGGFILGFAMEKWNLHNRIAYRIMLMTGSTPSRILAGVMLTSFLVSMWMSNTATTLMLVSAVIAIINQDELFPKGIKTKMAAALLIGLAYSATIGGMATLVGTPTNMIFAGYWETNFPDQPVSFLSWSLFAFPLSLILLVSAYLTLRFFFLRKFPVQPSGRAFIYAKYKSLGPLTFEQKAVMTVFSITVLLWFTRSGFDFGTVKISGWETLFPKGYMRDSTVAIMMATILFLIPSYNRRGTFILEWADILRLPLRIILLFGAGFALAEGFEVTGLGTFLAKQLAFFKAYPLWVIILMVVATVTLLSEFASNVATITLMLPVVNSLSVAIDVDPLTMMIPATLAASFGFMMPVATAPNTIAFASGHFRAGEMMKTGLVVNLVSIGILVAMVVLFK
jgi:solute carrier family 13 (sodium-dependent dicarboxylate transporter), member 2/3/5